jgi:hypothetical protein
MMSESDKFCRNCGAPAKYALGRAEKEKAFWRCGWFTVLMLFMCFPVGVILIFVNHPGLVRTFFMFLFGLILLGFVSTSFNSCAFDTSEPVPYKAEERKVDNGSVSENAKVENKTVVVETPQKSTIENKAVQKSVVAPDQDYFGKKLGEYKTAYKNADNKLQKSDVRRKQVEFLKSYFPNNKFEKWRGKVKDIDSVEKGKFASVEIECRKGDMIYIIATEKFNIKLTGKQTLIESTSPLYKEVFNLKKGDTVEFSANVIPNKESGLYLDNWVSEKYSVVKPEFIVQFTDIKKVE